MLLTFQAAPLPRIFSAPTITLIIAVSMLCGFASAIPLRAQTYDVTLYVDGQDPGALDTNDGSSSAPFKTIQAALSRAITNKRATPHLSTHVIIRPGTYREFVDVRTFTNFSNGQNNPTNATPILVEAEVIGTAIISGSDVFTDWQPDGDHYWHTWTKDWGPAPNPWGGATTIGEISLRREMVFVDGAWLRQVLTRAEMTDGTYYVDETADRIYVDPPAGVDFNTALKEVAVRERTWWQEYENNVTIRGLVFQHAAEPWSDIGGAARFVGNYNLIVEDCEFRWTNYIGFQVLDATGTILRRSILNNNGADGWGVYEVKDILLEDNETNYNNWRGNLDGFHSWSIGNKILSAHGLTIRRHRAISNMGRGLWIDEDNTNVILEDMVIENNLSDGIWLEANPGPIIVKNNTIRFNGASGLRSSYTENVTVEGNYIADNAQSQFLLVGSGGRGVDDFETGIITTLYLQNWTLIGNAFASGQKIVGTQFYEIESDWSRFASTLASHGNTWWHPSDPTPFQIDTENYSYDWWYTNGYAGDGSFWMEPEDTSPDPGYQPFVPDHPVISTTPSTLYFQSALVGDIRDENVGIANLGGQDLHVTGLTIAGTDAADFQVGSTAPTDFILTPGEAIRIEVLFAPTSGGFKLAELTATTNDPDVPTMHVTLSGSGVLLENTVETVYLPPDGYLPMYSGTPLFVNRALPFDGVTLKDAVSATVTLEIEDLDDAAEGSFYVNDVFVPWPPELVGTPDESTPRRHTMYIEMELLFEGTNELGFETNLPIEDGKGYQYIVNDLILAVRYDANPLRTVSLNLAEGWSLISSYLEPATPNVGDLFDPISEHIILVKDALGNFYSPDFSINSIGDWQSEQAYMVSASASSLLSITGTEIDPSTPIPLEAGWSWTAYWGQTSAEIATALSSISNELVLAKDVNGNIYFPELGITQLSELQPGMGYKYYLEAAGTLIYGEAAAGKSGGTSSTSVTSAGLASSATLILDVDSHLDDQLLSACVADRTVGSAVVKDGRAVITIIGKDPLQEADAGGAAFGDRLYARLGSCAEGVLVEMTELEDLLRREDLAELRYEDDGVWLGKAGQIGSDTDTEVPLEYALEPNFPNPFNPSTTIAYTLPHAANVELDVINVLGQRILSLVSGPQSAGRHQVNFSAYELSSGVYFYRLKTDDFLSMRRMVLSK